MRNPSKPRLLNVCPLCECEAARRVRSSRAMRRRSYSASARPRHARLCGSARSPLRRGAPAKPQSARWAATRSQPWARHLQCTHTQKAAFAVRRSASTHGSKAWHAFA
eukprot:1273345-Pleurochrysis_carterae.AAC.6